MEASKTRPHLGKFALIAEIARGGMGIVYLARVSGPAGFQKLAVIKQLKPEMVDDEKFLGMFMDEARLAARLNHRNIVQTNEVGEDAGRYYMAMEYLEGKTLQSVRTRLKGDRALPVPMVVRIACEVLAGLHYAHELADYGNQSLGIVHRDVSPQNVFITYDGQVKVLDFGVAKAYGRAQETEVGMLKGRVVCMSPEHVANDSVDRRADIFSMGVMLRETLTGKKVWENLSEMDVIKSLLGGRVPPFPEDDQIVDPALRAIIEKAMEPHRDDRWRTADEMRTALEEYVRKADPGGSLTKLGEIVAREFSDHRERVRALIEKHNAGASADFFPGAELPVLPTSSPEIGTSSSSSARSFTSKPRSTTGARSGGATVLAGEVPDVTGVAQAPSPRRTGSVIALLIAAVAVAIGGTAFVMRSRSSVTPDHSSASHANANTASPPASAAGGSWVALQPDVVELTVRASPATAQIFIDDAMVPENPFKAKYPRGGSHTVRVVAPGHAPKTESLTLGESMSMSVSLDKSGPGTTAVVVAPAAPPPRAAHAPAATPAQAPAATPTATPTAAPATPTDISPAGGKAPQRNIDQKNPYGN